MKKSQIILELQKEKQMLSNIRKDAEARVKKAPDGNVRLSKHGKQYQFFKRMNTSDTCGKYLPKSERQTGIALVQKIYDLKIIEASHKQEKTIERFLHSYNPKILQEAYNMLSDAKKQFVQPIDLPDGEYVKQWKSREYEKKTISEDIPEHYSSSGERVRSKSEVMIADALTNAGVPYLYECPLKLGSITVHPDFTILRVEDRQELYWEHLGMMDDPDYFQSALRKIRMYESFKIIPGNNLIITMESSTIPLNLTVIKNMIDAFCK